MSQIEYTESSKKLLEAAVNFEIAKITAASKLAQ